MSYRTSYSFCNTMPAQCDILPSSTGIYFVILFYIKSNNLQTINSASVAALKMLQDNENML